MFYRYFGNYLLSEGIITGLQLEGLVEYRKKNRSKLGFLAVEKGLMSQSQANEVHRMQSVTDQRFGDLAITKGYLTKPELEDLLELQESPYLFMVQAMKECDIMTKEQLNQRLTEFQQKFHLSEPDMEVLKGQDIEKMVQILLGLQGEANQVVSLVLKNIIRFISTDIAIGEATYTKSIEFNHVVVQEITGDLKSLLGFGCNNEELLGLATAYADEMFTAVDEDAMDAVGEFINCINGLFASKQSLDNIELELKPPVMNHKIRYESDHVFLILPMQIDGQWVKLILIQKNTWKTSDLM